VGNVTKSLYPTCRLIKAIEDGFAVLRRISNDYSNVSSNPGSSNLTIDSGLTTVPKP
jgi:hypothetical protein